MLVIGNFYLFNNLNIAPLLFDGRKKGKAALRARFYKSGQLMAEGKTYLDLKPLAEMYEHYTVGNTTTINFDQIPQTATRLTPFAYNAQSPEECE